MPENIFEEKVIAKMAVTKLGCNPKAASALNQGDRNAIPLCIIGGKATGTKSWEDSRGQIVTALTGEFGGINIQPGTPDYGTRFMSSMLFLPGGIHETIENAVIGETHDQTNTVEFAFEIRVVRADNPIGYSYQAVPKKKVKATETLAEIWGMVKILEAPKDAPKVLEMARETVEKEVDIEAAKASKGGKK